MSEGHFEISAKLQRIAKALLGKNEQAVFAWR